jgi:hypothetical protein
MRRWTGWLGAVAASAVTLVAAHADQPSAHQAAPVVAPPVVPSPVVPPPGAPSAEALALARTVVEASGAGGMNTMSGLDLPVGKLRRELGATTPPQVKAVMTEAVFPTLFDHTDELTNLQVKSYATLLSVDDMKAIIAFYNSPAGKDMLRARAAIGQTNMTRAFKLVNSLNMDFRANVKIVAKAHGWPTNDGPMMTPLP